MSKKRSLFLVVFVGLLVILCAGAVGIAIMYLRPLAKPMTVVVDDTATAEPTQISRVSEIESTSAPEIKSTSTPVSENTSTPEVMSTSAPEVNCNHSGVMTFMFLARDVSAGVWPYGADLIRFIRVDFSKKTVRIIAVPRDLWVETPHLDHLKIDHSRLGLVYYRVEQDTIGTKKQIATAATSAVAQAIYDNFKVVADHYIFFEMRDFATLIDQLGGLDVNIPARVTFDDHIYEAGLQHLDGEYALFYARFLPANELTEGWNRLARQELIFKSLEAKLLQTENILRIPSFINLFNDDVVTDLSPALMVDLTCMADMVLREDITLKQVEREMVLGAGPDSSMIPDVEKISKFLLEELTP
jgi:LCP family protein required for cell wall assembly